MIDFKIKDTPEGGAIEFSGSDVKLTGSWATMLYMGLFGGNTEAVTGQRNAGQIAEDYWANSLLFQDKPQKQNNSRTENALKSGVIGYDAVRKVTEAAQKDLIFFQQFANLEVEVEEQGYHSIALNITVQEPGNLENKLYQFVWDATEQELKGLPGEEPDLTEYEDFQFTGKVIPSVVQIFSFDGLSHQTTWEENIEFNTGLYDLSKVETTNVTSFTIKRNGSPVSGQFELTSGDTIQVDITRTTDCEKSEVKLVPA